MATRQGIIKKTPIEQFERVRSTGIRAITVAEGDDLAWVGVSSGDDDIVLATALGKIARFHETRGPADGPRRGRRHRHPPGPRRRPGRGHGRRPARGNDILVLTETGYGKRVALTEFRRKHRGSQGVRLISLEGAKTGRVAAVELVDESGRGAAAHQRRAARSCAPTSRASTATAARRAASSSCASTRATRWPASPSSGQDWQSSGRSATMTPADGEGSPVGT